MGGTWGDGPNRDWRILAGVVLLCVVLWYLLIHLALWVGRLIGG